MRLLLGQIASAVLLCVFHLRLNKEFEHGCAYMKPDWRIIRGIYAIGLPAIIAQALMSIMVYALNLILKFNQSAADCIWSVLQGSAVCAVSRIWTQGCDHPITAYSYGMGDRKRINDAIKYGIIYTIVLMVFGMAVTELFPAAFAWTF